MKKFAIWIGGVALAGFLAGCQARSEASVAAPAPAAAQQQAKAADDSAMVDVDQKMLPNIHIESAAERSVPKVLTATGKVQFNEDHTSRVLAPLPGQVMDLNVRLGDTVAKDQVVFSIRSREVAAMVAELQQAQRDQDLAQKTFAMQTDLYDHQAASRIAVQQAEADLTRAKTQVARAGEALRVLGLDPASGLNALVPVRSPGAGTVIERIVTPGQYVQADATSLLTIADLSSVWVMVDVFERDLHLVHAGQRVQVTATAYPDRQFTAHVDRISDRVDPDSRTIKVRLLVSNTGMLLKPEMFISASLILNESTRALTIPSAALISEGDHGYAFVAKSDTRFERREVASTPSGDGRLQVTSGIRPGDRVVADGALLLRLYQKQQQQPE